MTIRTSCAGLVGGFWFLLVVSCGDGGKSTAEAGITDLPLLVGDASLGDLGSDDASMTTGDATDTSMGRPDVDSGLGEMSDGATKFDVDGAGEDSGGVDLAPSVEVGMEMAGGDIDVGSSSSDLATDHLDAAVIDAPGEEATCTLGTVENCGACGRSCSTTNVASASCDNGLCTSTCLAGYGNCSQPAAPGLDDGCESNLATDNANCGSCGHGCVTPEACNSPSQPGICAKCTNLCLRQVLCPGTGVTTAITGTVYAPNGTHPLPNVHVYIPNAPLEPLTDGVTCNRCSDGLPSSPLVQTRSGVDGSFRLENVPVGANVPLVIQTGKWRKQLTITTVNACVDNPVPGVMTRLPRNRMEGDIPRMAFSTGAGEATECLLRLIGLDLSEFTSITGNGRIHLYSGAHAGGATYSGTGSPKETDLVESLPLLKGYDMIFFGCQGGLYTETTTALQNLLQYTTAGGRVFTSHYGLNWLYTNSPLSTTATWNVGQATLTSGTGYLEMTTPMGLTLAQWLTLPAIGASTTMGQLPLSDIRYDFSSVDGTKARLWLSTTIAPYGQVPSLFTFNTPVGDPIGSQCGRVAFSDIHFYAGVATPTTAFPTECTSTTMTAQQKLFEYLLFDLGACIESN